MSRRIIYKIPDWPEYLVTEEEWDEVRRLQHWYNSEFSWSAGKLAFKRYILFPNGDEVGDLDVSLWEVIGQRREKLRRNGYSEYDIVRQLEKDHLAIVKWGGYFDDCLASGFTRVADNEWNALLVCDFLVKVSTLLPHVIIEVADEGKFVRTGTIWLRDGIALLPRKNGGSKRTDRLIKQKRFFAVVDPKKFDKHPSFRNSIPNFNRLKEEDRRVLVKNWNWLGYGNDSTESEGTEEGVDLNQKLRGFDFLD